MSNAKLWQLLLTAVFEPSMIPLSFFSLGATGPGPEGKRFSSSRLGKVCKLSASWQLAGGNQTARLLLLITFILYLLITK